MADPSKFNLVLDFWFLGIFVLQDGKFKPRPNASELIIAEALVMRLREELNALNSINQSGGESLINLLELGRQMASPSE